jgi:hypothetical protein
MSEHEFDQLLDSDLQHQMDELRHRVAADRIDLDSLERRADASDARQDASDARQDASDARQDASDARQDKSDVRAGASDLRQDQRDARQDRTETRLGLLEASAAVDHELVGELRSDWEFGHEGVAQLEQALQSSRMIGAAMGIVMADRRVTPADAFAALARASQNANRKLRESAADVVDTGDVSGLPSP